MSLSKSLFKMSKKMAKSAYKEAKKSMKPSKEKLPRSKQKKTTKNPGITPEWEVNYDKNGLPIDFYKNGKEWISSSSEDIYVSPSGQYFLHCDSFCMDSNSLYIAITTKEEGLNKKTFEGGANSAFITDDGIGYIYSDGDLYTLTVEKKSKKHLCDYPEAHLLIPKGCFVAFTSYDSYDEDQEQVIVKAVLLDSGKTWRKTINYECPDKYHKIEMNLSDNNIMLSLPNGKVVFLDYNGKLL